MDMVLTGRMMAAAGAERCGLVSCVVPAADLVEEGAEERCQDCGILVAASLYDGKEAVNRSYETTLAEGLHFERRLFHSMFALKDQKEVMAAFVEKRPPNFRDR